jgi:hypothetical protein
MMERTFKPSGRGDVDLARIALTSSIVITGAGAVPGLFWWVAAALWIGSTARTLAGYGQLALICVLGVVLVGTPGLATILGRQGRLRLAQLICLPALAVYCGVALMLAFRR